MARLLVLALGTLAACVMAVPVEAQQPDTTRRDTVHADSIRSYALPPIEVIGSIIPFAGPRIGSGIPARLATFTGREIDAWEPRTLADALGTRAGVSFYDDLGSPYKLNLSTRGFNVGPVVGLPPGVSEDQISARYDNGELEVHVNKPAVEMPHRIQIGNGKAAIGTGKAAIEGKTTKA